MREGCGRMSRLVCVLSVLFYGCSFAPASTAVPSPLASPLPSPTGAAPASSAPSPSGSVASAAPVSTADSSTAVAGPSRSGWFVSQLYPYQLQLPAGWAAVPGGFVRGDLQGDLFTPTGAGGVQVNVLSETLPADLAQNQAQYLQLTREALLKSGYSDVRDAGTTMAGGTSAALLTFTDYGRPQQVTQVTQAVWAAGGRGWVATLVQPEGVPDHSPQLREMLASFRTP